MSFPTPLFFRYHLPLKPFSATSILNCVQSVEDFPNETCFLLHNITFHFLGHPIVSIFSIGKILPQTELNFDQKGQKMACTDLENIWFGKK
jgi:hypothetical protein